MDKFDRIFHLHAVLSTRRTAIPLEDLMARLECSKSTLFHVISAAELTERLNFTKHSALEGLIHQHTKPRVIIRDTAIQAVIMRSISDGAIREYPPRARGASPNRMSWRGTGWKTLRVTSMRWHNTWSRSFAVSHDGNSTRRHRRCSGLDSTITRAIARLSP